MSDKQRYGDGDDCDAIPPARQTVDGTTPIVSNLIDMRRYDSISFQLITEGDVEGEWVLEASNNYVPPCNNVYGGIEESGDWTDVTDQFTPTVTAVTEASNQCVQADLTARTVRATFTPTDGDGTVRAIVFAKSWS